MMKHWLWLGLAAIALCAPAAAQQGVFQADNTLSVYSVIWPNNATAVQVCTGGCRIYQVDAFNNSTSLGYIRLYNAATATCGTTTPQWRGMIPFGSSSSGGGFSLPWVNGDSYSLGTWVCVTTGIADSDATAPSASQFIVNIHYKKVNP